MIISLSIASLRVRKYQEESLFLVVSEILLKSTISLTPSILFCVFKWCLPNVVVVHLMRWDSMRYCDYVYVEMHEYTRCIDT